MERDRFLQNPLLSVKLVLECIAVDRILCDAAQLRVSISRGFEEERRSNCRRYYQMVERLAGGSLYTVNAIGNPFCIDFKALGCSGDPVIHGGRFKKRPMGYKAEAGQ